MHVPVGDRDALARQRHFATPPQTDAARSFDGPRYRDIEAIIYTSGTTGPSKGVLVPWASAYQMFSWVPADTLAPGEAIYCAFQPFHIAGKSVSNLSNVTGKSRTRTPHAL